MKTTTIYEIAKQLLESGDFSLSESIRRMIDDQDELEARMYQELAVPASMMGGREMVGNMPMAPFPDFIREFQDTATRLLYKSVERRKKQLWLSSLDTRPWWAVKLY